MNVLVLGANGFIGPAVVAALRLGDHRVSALARRAQPERDGVTAIAADRSDPDAIATIVAERQIAVVVDLLAMTIQGTSPLLAALRGRIERYVLVSSGDVYRQYGALHKREMAQRLDLLTEDAALRTKLFPYRGDRPRAMGDPLSWMDDYDKIPIESEACACGDSTIVRLPMVFGPGDRQRRFRWAMPRSGDQNQEIELDAAWAAWRCSYGYVGDMGAGVALAATHPAARGRVYNLGPLQTLDHAQWARRFADRQGRGGAIRVRERRAVSPALAAQLDRLDLTVPLVLDSSRIRRELGYREVTDEDQALDRTIAAERGTSS